MIATRFRSVAWTGCVCAAALSFYMVSQTVAAKRAELASVERKIVITGQEIRDLRTEIDTRGGLAQIESWNARVYGLQAPGAGQFVNSSVQLVAMTQPQAQPLDPMAPPSIGQNQGAIRQASFNQIEDSVATSSPKTPAPIDPAPVTLTSATNQPAIERPMLRQATFVQAKPSALAPAAPSPVHEVADRKPARLIAAVAKAAAPTKPQKMTALSEDWLADVTGDKSGGRSRKVKP